MSWLNWVPLGLTLVTTGVYQFTFMVQQRRIRDLELALVARRALLNEDEPTMTGSGLVYGDISPAVAAYSAVRTLDSVAPYLANFGGRK